MSTLTIKDLSLTQELGAQAMKAVRGGMHKGFAPYWAPYYAVSKQDFAVKADQLIGQTQNVTNVNGNNVAFADHIKSTVNPTQTATNNISF